MKESRLFVPLTREAFEWFKSGSKTWELRGYGRTYTPYQILTGRKVELRKGYRGESLWGVIGDHIIGSSIEDILERVDFRLIVPIARNRAEAMTIIQTILGDRRQYIAFEVKATRGLQ